MPPPLFFGPDEPDGPRFGLQLADGRKVIVQRLGEMKPFLAATRPADPAAAQWLGGGPPIAG